LSLWVGFDGLDYVLPLIARLNRTGGEDAVSTNVYLIKCMWVEIGLR
jgi:hypothetical protein